MTVEKYIVVWHEENDSGVPKHCMGASDVCNTENEAKMWIEGTIEEDRARHKDGPCRDYGEFTFEKLQDSDNVWYSYGNGQKTFYEIVKVSVEDNAADCIDEVRKILLPTVVAGRPLAAEDRCRCALIYIGEHKHEWLPLREWMVAISFGSFVHSICVLAHTCEEAQTIVERRIAEGNMGLTDDEKDDLVKSLLRHVVRVEAMKDPEVSKCP